MALLFVGSHTGGLVPDHSSALLLCSVRRSVYGFHCGGSVLPVFRLFSEGGEVHIVVALVRPWDVVSSGSCYSAVSPPLVITFDSSPSFFFF